MTHGTPGLIIPAFSRAIFASVLPKNSVWSMPILVMTDRTGVSTFVLSSLPPKPVSITAISTFCCTKYQNPRAVMVSKNEGCSSSRKALCSVTNAATVSSGIGLPLTRIRSVSETRCGEVNKPTRSPAACSAAAIRWLVEPFPFVPATCTALSTSCGLPTCAIRRSVFSSPGLYAAAPTR